MIHERFDFEHWRKLFDLDAIRRDPPPALREQYGRSPIHFGVPMTFEQFHLFVVSGARRITGPSQLVRIEQMRKEMAETLPVGEPVPTDVFVWASGEAPRRDTTKIAGLPYWPRSRPWPETEDGEPMAYICQLCFADSRDIVGPLPGDVLVIFAHPVWERIFDPGKRGMGFAWLDLGETDLVGDDDVPPTHPDLGSLPLYAQIHRTADYPALGPDGGWDPDHPEWSNLGSVPATKIGGMPVWLQLDPELPGRYLANFISIEPERDEPFPFINVPEPIITIDPLPFLCLGDVGELYLYLDGDEVHWEMQW